MGGRMKNLKLLIVILVMVSLLTGCSISSTTAAESSSEVEVLWENVTEFETGIAYREAIESIAREEIIDVINEKNPIKAPDSYRVGRIINSEASGYKKFVKSKSYGDFARVDFNIIYDESDAPVFMYYLELEEGEGESVIEIMNMDYSGGLDGSVNGVLSVRYGIHLKLENADEATVTRLNKLGFEASEYPGNEDTYYLEDDMTINLDEFVSKEY